LTMTAPAVLKIKSGPVLTMTAPAVLKIESRERALSFDTDTVIHSRNIMKASGSSLGRTVPIKPPNDNTTAVWSCLKSEYDDQVASAHPEYPGYAQLRLLSCSQPSKAEEHQAEVTPRHSAVCNDSSVVVYSGVGPPALTPRTDPIPVLTLHLPPVLRTEPGDLRGPARGLLDSRRS